MTITPAMALARREFGYRPPADDPYRCETCGACKKYKQFYCLLGGFFVHSHGLCPRWTREPFAKEGKATPKFVQEEMGL